MTKYITYYTESSSKSTVENLHNKKFLSIEGNPIFNFNKDSIYWFKVSFIHEAKQPSLWLLEFLDPHIHDLKVYQIMGNDTTKFDQTGSQLSFNSRIVSHKNYAFPLYLRDSIQATLLFTFKNDYPSKINVILRPSMQFIDYALDEYYFLGLFYGILLIMAVYNLFIFLNTKENVYLYYVAYVFCYCLNAFQEDGLGFQYLWSSHPWINPLVNILAPLLLIITFVLYSEKFLVIHQYSKKLRAFIHFTLLSYCVCYLLDSFFLNFAWMKYLYLFPFTLVFISGIITWQRGNRSAKYFLFAFSFLILCFTVLVLRVTNIIPTNIFTVYALNFGFLIEVVLFSLAMGQKLKIDKEEKASIDEKLMEQLVENEKLKDVLNKNLEYKVVERTKALEEALEELQLKNLEIEKLNKLLENDNQILSQDIKEMTKARLLLKDLTLEEFKNIYPNEDACLKYLSEIKWKKAYNCKKCSGPNFSAGKTFYSRRCTRCGYDESVTSNTLFHNSKIPITSTFYLVYLVLANKNISSHELSEKLALRQKTCWSFKKKIIEAIQKTSSAKLNSREWGNIFYN